VTEEITGQDLVEWQLRVASGESLPKRQDELEITGWAVEARLYAENPATGFLPSTGRLDLLRLPDDLRIESGVEEGDQVTPFYDPMIAKLVASASDRHQAITVLRDACQRTMLEPVKSNAWFLARLLAAPALDSAHVTTGYIADHLAELTLPPEPTENLLQAAADQAIFHDDFVIGRLGDPDFDHLNGFLGFRLNAPPNRTVRLDIDGECVEVEYRRDGEQAYWDAGGSWTQFGQVTTLFANGAAFDTRPFRAEGATAGTAADGAILSPMPGRIIAVEVAPGEGVAKGQKLVTLEAMKMEHTLTAPFDGTITALDATEGAQVSEGALLVRVERKE